MVGDPIPEISYVLLEGRGVPAGVEEDPPMPLGETYRQEREILPVETETSTEPRRSLQPPVEPVGPRVVRAADELAARAAAHLKEVVTTVAAHIVEGAQDPILVPDEQCSLVPEGDRLPVAGAAQVLRTADADPALVEEVIHLPRQHRVLRVGRPGQAHLPVRHNRRDQ